MFKFIQAVFMVFIMMVLWVALPIAAALVGSGIAVIILFSIIATGATDADESTNGSQDP